nr:LacI family DNA-binding transcriptional regulator [Pseudomonas sp. A29(2023)]
MTVKENARDAGVSPSTVSKRLKSAMFKLGASCRTALVSEASRRRIISPVSITLPALIAW